MEKGNYKKYSLILVIAAVMLAIPITINFLSQTQDIRQRAAQVCANVAVDIMLVVDKSGSMKGTSLTSAKSAAKSFVDTVSSDSQNRIGLVSFSSEPKTTLDNSLSNNFSGVKSKIDSLAADGETCTGCGLKKANDHIASAKRSGIKNVVILLTDGIANRIIGEGERTDFARAASSALDEVRRGKNQNDTVYFTIGLGNDVKTDFLQQIANETGGKYFSAPSASNLQAIYSQISQIVGKGGVSGFVFNDANNNGLQEQNETKLSGFELELRRDTQLLSAVTDGSGGFSIAGICDGAYTLSLKPKQGFTQTSPPEGKYNLVITEGDAQAEKSFGVTQQSLSTSAALSLKLTGIGASTSAGTNNNPKRPQRNIMAAVINSQNIPVASYSGNAVFDPTSGVYRANITLGPNFQSGPYLIKVKMDNTLWKNVPGIQNIVSGTTYQAPTFEFVSGNINSDNEINLSDYTFLLGCIKGHGSCSAAN